MKKKSQHRLQEMFYYSPRNKKDCCKEVSLHTVNSRSEQGSIFKAYLANVSNMEEIQSAYRAVHYKHVSATHVMAGFRIFGSQFYQLQDYVDNDEWGGGRQILNVIKGDKTVERCYLYGKIQERPQPRKEKI